MAQQEIDILIRARDEATKKLRLIERTTQTLKSAFSSLAGAMGLGIGVGAFVMGTKKMIDAASDTNESLNKVREVFGEAAKTIENFAERGATALGASKQQTLAMTGEIGNLLVAFGFAEDAAADMSKQVVQLAADLGSFNNVPTEEALLAIRSALVGESEPMRRFGADVRETRLQQIALAEGIIKTKRALTAQERAMAAMAAIMKDTAKAQGDFTRTSDGLANSTKILMAKIEDTAAALGKILAPAFNSLVNAAIDAHNAIVDILTDLGLMPSKVEKMLESILDARKGFATIQQLQDRLAELKDVVGELTEKGGEIHIGDPEKIIKFAESYSFLSSEGQKAAKEMLVSKDDFSLAFRALLSEIEFLEAGLEKIPEIFKKGLDISDLKQATLDAQGLIDNIVLTPAQVSAKIDKYQQAALEGQQKMNDILYERQRIFHESLQQLRQQYEEKRREAAERRAQWEQEIEDRIAAYKKQKAEEALAEAEEYERRMEEMLQRRSQELTMIYSAFWGNVGRALIEDKSLKDAFKQTLNMLIDYIEREFVIAQASVAIRALISGGTLLWSDLAKSAAAMVALESARVAVNSFQYGGSFIVGGTGGPDSQLVAFRASPGERVTITPPNQVMNQNYSTVHYHINAIDAASFRDFMRRRGYKVLIEDQLRNKW